MDHLQQLDFCSDVTSDSANHSAQFLGTAIVHAHETETCGIKGLRILLHPSIIPLLSDIQHNPLTSNNSYSIYNIECSENEQENKIGIKHEINYWDLKPTRELEAWHGLQDMWNDAPASEKKHYTATAKAINRMRIFQGFEPLKKFASSHLAKMNQVIETVAT